MANQTSFSPESMEDEFVAAFNTAPPYTIPQKSPTTNSPGTKPMNPQPESPRLNPRSCVTCRRRKVRCDKREPCSNCTKAHIECVFPPPGRAPRKPRRPQDAELLKRLRRLESVVDSLGAQVDDDGTVSQETDSIGSRRPRPSEVPGEWPTPNARKSSLENNLGRLVIKEGRSRYVGNDFWASLGDEISELRDVLDGPTSEDEEEAHSPETAHSDPSQPYQHHQGFVFGYSSLMYDMDKLHPTPSQIFILWEIFKENVDPILKLVHAPTVKNVIMKAAVSASSLSRTSEALFYCICFASVVSMSEDQCRSLLDGEKDRLLQKYRFAVEQGLARAAFLNSSSLMVLQAFVMYLMTVRYEDSSQAVWSLAGLAIQQGRAQGLHRDPSNFNLDPFETEMRRRLWWHIMMLDARASEDHGADPSFNDRFFDTKMPLNVNDEDIWPGMKDLPKERPGASDMTFCLVRFELSDVQRKLRLTASECPSEARERTLNEKELLIDKTHQRIEEQYLQHCDPNVPLLWVCATVGRLILAKMWLMVHHPRLNHEEGPGLPDLRERIFTTCVEVIEFGHLLSTNKNTAKWGWLFRTYMQWHAVCYILSELSVRPATTEAERAWRAIDAVYDKRMKDQVRGQRSVFWRPLKQLYAKAKAHRDQIGVANGVSPNSNRSGSNSDQMSPNDSNQSVKDTWMAGYPYGNAVSNTAESLGLDFSDMGPEMNLNAMNMGISPGTMGLTSGIGQNLNAPIESIQWTGWNPEINDISLGTPGPQNWMTPMQQQEWF